MQRLANAVFAFIRANATIAAFAGVAPGGAVGPFLDLAPAGTLFPYMVISQIPGMPNTQFFGTAYVGRVHLQFKIIGPSLETVAGHCETFCTIFDAIASLTLTGGEVTRKPLRMEEPRFIHEPIAGDGSRIYSGIIQYRFAVQRARGS
jgi:hypothetical protein